MTDIRQQAGIRTRIWIAGKFSIRDPLPTITPRRLEKKTTTSNGTVRVDRLFTVEGLPNVLKLYQIGLTWADLREAGLLEHVDTLGEIGQPFWIGLWKHFYCAYDGDGSTTTFLLPRLSLLDIVTPPIEFPDYPTRVTVYDKPLTDPTATATELTSGQFSVEAGGHAVNGAIYSTLTLGVTPANAHDVLRVAYMPAFRVVIDAEDPRAYGAALNEPRGIKLVETG